MSLVLYGLLFVVVEIFFQPRVATERQKGLLDNSLGTKLLIGNTEGYYDNDNVPIGAKKLLVNTFENCFFTYSIMKKMLPQIATYNIILFIVLLGFAYFGFNNNEIAMALLQAQPTNPVECVQSLTQKHVAKRYVIAEKFLPLHHES